MSQQGTSNEDAPEEEEPVKSQSAEGSSSAPMEEEAARRGKRNKANRASAARSKVRKMRLIAELESKSAVLQQQVVDMTAELRTLHEDTLRIGSENEWLLSQVHILQEQSAKLDLETQSHLWQTMATSQAPRSEASEPRRSTSVNIFGHVQQQPFESQQGLLPESAFAVGQDPGPLSLQIPQRQILPSSLSRHPSFAAVTSHFRGGEALHPVVPDLHQPLFPEGQSPLHPYASQPFGTDRFGAASAWATLNSYGSDSFTGSGPSGLSGLSSTTQELQLQAENPALLNMLRSFDLGQRQSSGGSGLPYLSGSGQFERSSSMGMMPPSPQHQAPLVPPRGMGLPPARMASLPPPPLIGPPFLESRRHSSQGGLQRGFQQPAGGFGPPPVSAGIGLSRWPRHVSEPMRGYQWPPQSRPQ